jgi:hypothetical protein
MSGAENGTSDAKTESILGAQAPINVNEVFQGFSHCAES